MIKSDQTEQSEGAAVKINGYDIERIAKILSLVAIPIVLAVFGWIIQDRLSEQNLSQEYVKLAVTILEKPKSSEVPGGLRNWAVDLLNQNSPTKFAPETIRELKAGEISLAGLLGNVLATANQGGGVAVSPDARTAAIGLDNGSVAIWDIHSGGLLQTLAGHTGSVTSVVYQPDAKRLFSGGLDGLAIAWDIPTARVFLKLECSSPVLGLAVSPDEQFLIAPSADGYLRSWVLSTGQLRSETKLKAPGP